MQPEVHIPLPNHHWDAIYGTLGQRLLENYHLPRGKVQVLTYFRQKLGSGRALASQNFQPRSIRTLPMQLSSKKIDPPITFVERERQS